jgi:hypothetical protein
MTEGTEFGVQNCDEVKENARRRGYKDENRSREGREGVSAIRKTREEGRRTLAPTEGEH